MKFFTLLVTTALLLTITACDSKKETQPTQEPPPKNLNEIRYSFHNVQLVEENGKSVLTANIVATYPAVERLAYQDGELSFFLQDLFKYFPDVKPNRARFTYLGSDESDMKPIYVVEFDMANIYALEKVGKSGQRLYNYADSFTKIDVEKANEMIQKNCGIPEEMNTKVCTQFAKQ